MATAEMAEPLYTRDILRLAADSAELVRLDDPHGRAEARSPVCGSAMIAEVTIDGQGRVAAFGGEVHACAMGQASATLVMRHAAGMTPGDVAAARDGLIRYLGGETDKLPWAEMAVFAPVRSRPARHGAIMLPFDAMLAAIESAR